ncbi:MAG TPA: hypothetical protein PKE65_06530 [Rhizobiaceae bacterium]|nr:hypothetical protein [Rhizobiaceae bacterium]
MLAALAVMTILGCNDAETDCRFVRAVDEQFASLEECDARAEHYLRQADDVAQPVVVAVCETDPALADATMPAGETDVAAASDGKDSRLPPPKETAPGDFPPPPNPFAGTTPHARQNYADSFLGLLKSAADLPRAAGQATGEAGEATVKGVKRLAGLPVDAGRKVSAWVLRRNE